MSWIFSNILSHCREAIELLIIKLIAVYLAGELMSAIVSYVALKGLAHGMVCSSESHWGLNLHDVISVQCYMIYLVYRYHFMIYVNNYNSN